MQVNCSALQMDYNHLLPIYGMVFLYKQSKFIYKPYVKVNVSNYQYKSFGSCSHFSHYAVTLLLRQCYTIYFNINDVTFNNLKNSSVLYYYHKKCANVVKNMLFIRNLKIYNNVGNSQLKMVYIDLADAGSKDNIFKNSYRHQSLIIFRNCDFINNTNFEAIIFIVPTKAEKAPDYIEIKQGKFCNNTNVHFIKVKSATEILWKLPTYIKVKRFTIVSNKHQNGNSLISIMNGILVIEGSTFITKNSLFQNIIKLHFSMVVCKGHIEFTNNTVRFITSGNSGSFFLVTEYTTLIMSNNTVYMVVRYDHTFAENSQVVCPIQFYSTKGNLDQNPLAFNCTIVLLDNVFMVSKYLPGNDSFLKNCKWFGDSAFQTTKPSIVYSNTMTIKNFIINRTDHRKLPLSICPCTNFSDYDCFSTDLGSLFPGQTLNIKLIVSEQWMYVPYFATTLTVENTLDDDCRVVDSQQLSQTHLNYDCNTYEYTIWPSHDYIRECNLFVGLRGMPEMFYIHVKPCPKGFTRQQEKMACDCDPLLDNNVLSVTSCNLDDETILRPANSWITADTVNYTHTYQLASQCPFDYCLPDSSNLNLSYPDSQCQFERIGVLCGQCGQGQSSVFGLSLCMQCSHVYLFITIPIAIAGVVLVIALFVFNLTITNGVINSFIFYVNIICINYSLFYPESHSLDYSLLSLFNLDLGIQTCFYDGMDDYTKTLLQLAFPFYLIFIAFMLIIGSRYSARIQKLTAHRALPVLSTLFLLSYTKILLTVCRVLFCYTRVTEYPSTDSTLVWLVDISTPLFGIRYFVAFFICLIIFVLLLLFNILLLFTRKLLYFQTISSFKPLLDTYLGPYKDKHYYWTGLQLLVRAMFLGLSALSKQVNLTCGIIVLGMLLCIQGTMHPFKSRYKNYQELLLMLNLQAVYTIALYSTYKNSVDTLIVRILIMLVQVYIIICVICHCVMSVSTCRKKVAVIQNKIIYAVRIQPFVKKTSDMAIEMKSINHECTSQNYHEFQEPLIGLDN